MKGITTISAALISFLLIGCSPEDKDSSAPTEEQNPHKLTEITGSDLSGEFVQDGDEINDIEMTGSNNTIVFRSRGVIGELSITGSNNYLTFEENVSVQVIDITGSDNYIEYPEGMTFKQSVFGSGNTFNPL